MANFWKTAVTTVVLVGGVVGLVVYYGEYRASAKKMAFTTDQLFNATKAVYNAALRQGYGTADTAAVCAVLDRRSRLRVNS